MHSLIRWPTSVFTLLLLLALPVKAQFNTEVIGGYEVVANEALVKNDFAPGFSQALQQNAIVSTQAVGGMGWSLAKSDSLSTADLVANLSRAGVTAEPNYVVHAVDTIPNDQYWPLLYGMVKISTPAAWDLSTGSTTNVVGVVDTGVNYNHPDLIGNLWSAPADFSMPLISCPAGSFGYNAINNTCNPLDDAGHGTHTSGTVGAVGNNGIGVVGVNWTASIVAAKFLNAQGSGTTAGAINAIEFTIELKQVMGVNVRVLSNSWGGGGFSAALRDEIASARDNDILFVAAAGNNNSNNDVVPVYPANYAVENVISVAATNQTDARASFSDYGATTVHLGAPGVHIASTYQSGYAYADGTSMATPHVAGAGALILSYCPMNTPTLKAALLNNVDPVPGLSGITITGGRLNVFAAMNDPSCVPPPP